LAGEVDEVLEAWYDGLLGAFYEEVDRRRAEISRTAMVRRSSAA
jgi:hypothetical protein